jgi:lipoyl(octanoyl) transferase
MRIRNLGFADYLPVWQAMRDFSAQRTADTEDELWLVQHPAVFTLGQAGRRTHLLAPWHYSRGRD